jgi:hypothetical protein
MKNNFKLIITLLSTICILPNHAMQQKVSEELEKKLAEINLPAEYKAKILDIASQNDPAEALNQIVELSKKDPVFKKLLEDENSEIEIARVIGSYYYDADTTKELFTAYMELAKDPLIASLFKAHMKAPDQTFIREYSLDRLYSAAKYSMINAAKIILDASEGRFTPLLGTALITAIKNRDEEMIDLLMDYGADLNKKTFYPITHQYGYPIQFAHPTDQDLIEFLRSRGARTPQEIEHPPKIPKG